MANYTTVFHPPEKDKKKVESPSKSYPFWSNNENLQTHLCIYQYIIIYCIYNIYICELINLLTTHPIFSNIVQTWARHLKHRSCIWMNSGAFVNSKSSSNSFKNSTCLSTGNPHTTSHPSGDWKGCKLVKDIGKNHQLKEKLRLFYCSITGSCIRFFEVVDSKYRSKRQWFYTLTGVLKHQEFDTKGSSTAQWLLPSTGTRSKKSLPVCLLWKAAPRFQLETRF